MRTLIAALALAGVGLTASVGAQQPWRYDDGRTDGRYRTYRPSYGPDYRDQRADAASLQPIHMFVGINTGDTVFSSRPRHEDQRTLAVNYEYYGVAFYVSPHRQPGMVPLYRYSSPYGEHGYTTNPGLAQREGAGVEGLLGYIYSSPRRGTVPIHVWLNHETGWRHYTTDDRLPRQFEYLGVLGYAVNG